MNDARSGEEVDGLGDLRGIGPAAERLLGLPRALTSANGTPERLASISMSPRSMGVSTEPGLMELTRIPRAPPPTPARGRGRSRPPWLSRRQRDRSGRRGPRPMPGSRSSRAPSLHDRITCLQARNVPPRLSRRRCGSPPTSSRPGASPARCRRRLRARRSGRARIARDDQRRDGGFSRTSQLSAIAVCARSAQASR